MKQTTIFCVFLFGLTISAQETMTVTMTGDSAGYMETSFVQGCTLIKQFSANGPNKQFNFGDLRIAKKGNSYRPYLKYSGDDACPWNFNGTYIGANHGDSIASAIICKKPHGLTMKDCGTTWRDSRGEAFHIVKIEKPNVFWVLSDNKSKDKDIWKFIRPLPGTLKDASGRTIQDYTVKIQQLYSPVRILKRVFKADGKILPSKGTFKCKVFTVEEEYDIVATDAILKHVLKNKGRQVTFNAPGLDRVLNQKIVYTFYPDNSCIVTHNVTFFRNVQSGSMGFIQASPFHPSKEFPQHLYYIPKTKPFKAENRILDFAHTLDYTKKIKSHFLLGPETFEDPKSMPDRYIQYLCGSKNFPDIGFVCGYSLLEGCTVPEQRLKNTKYCLYLYKSHKTYPYAIDSGKLKMIKAGQKFYCMAYRQFIDPTANFYINRQGKYKVLYVDFHKPVKDKIIPLPPDLLKKEMSVVEHRSTVKFVKAANGLSFTSTDKYGYAVLKFKL